MIIMVHTDQNAEEGGDSWHGTCLNVAMPADNKSLWGQARWTGENLAPFQLGASRAFSSQRCGR